ncbi:MAG: hypothetical protein ACI8RP_000751, partial [Urechidicola sp.]
SENKKEYSIKKGGKNCPRKRLLVKTSSQNSPKKTFSSKGSGFANTAFIFGLSAKRMFSYCGAFNQERDNHNSMSDPDLSH